MKGIPLESIKEYSYLGVTLHHGMSWIPHINNVCNKANRWLGFLKRNLHHCLSGLKEMADKQLILPCLGYFAAIWDPFHHNLIYQLEMIQHRTTCFVLNQPWIRGHHDSITEMLIRTLEWTTLETQRSHSRLLLLFKILNHHVFISDQYLLVRNPSQND